MNNVILYSLPGCPKCEIIHNKLDNKHIVYTECQDPIIMGEKEIVQCPVLEVNGTMYSFYDANKWVNEQE